MRAGDTLAGIAQSLWGDASLWYLIADANGLAGSEPLAAGRLLSIPNKVHNGRCAVACCGVVMAARSAARSLRSHRSCGPAKAVGAVPAPA